MKIEVLGAGCPKCRATEKRIEEVAEEMRADVEIIEISDVDEIVNRGVMMTPAVFVDGKLKSTGKVPSKEELRAWIAGKQS
ncbi:MAG: thioredoxin family protein [Candidatus Thermoplasmatota archaeon]|nr:thioredoxin family protein [Candidatus Thermoplasmatota archaeon]